jgi:type IV pilus assembly protein PilA
MGMMKQTAALRFNNRHGFTMIELMIVVAIIGLLTTIAIPNFLTYQAKARQAEAKAALGAIFSAATTVLFLDNGTYAVSVISQLPFSPSGLTKYSFWYDVGGVPSPVPGSDTSNAPCDVSTVTTFVTPLATPTGFTATTKGNIDTDATCDEWSINDARILENPSNDVTS